MGTLSAGLSYKVVIMATTFEKRNYCATALALVVFGLTVAAAVVDWYAQADVYHRSTDSAASRSASNPDSLIDTSELNFTKVRYDLEGFTVESKTSAGTIDKEFFTYNSRTGSDVRNVFKTSQAFVIIALVIAFVLSVLLSLFFFDRIRNKFIFSFGMSVTRVFVAVLALLAAISTAIAFLVFLGVTQAFEEELVTCTEGPCRAFIDTIRTEGLKDTSDNVEYDLIRTQQWGPEAGWYLTLAAIPTSVLLLAVVVLNKFPLPIDSEASSGEAL